TSNCSAISSAAALLPSAGAAWAWQARVQAPAAPRSEAAAAQPAGLGPADWEPAAHPADADRRLSASSAGAPERGPAGPCRAAADRARSYQVMPAAAA